MFLMLLLLLVRVDVHVVVERRELLHSDAILDSVIIILDASSSRSYIQRHRIMAHGLV